ncbi:hypothetical protein ABEV00_21945 [Paenibacillus thiaminolyticus]
MELSRKQMGTIISLALIALFIIGFINWGPLAFESFPERLGKIAPQFSR